MFFPLLWSIIFLSSSFCAIGSLSSLLIKKSKREDSVTLEWFFIRLGYTVGFTIRYPGQWSLYIEIFQFHYSYGIRQHSKGTKVKRGILALLWHNSFEFSRLTPGLPWNKGSSEWCPIDQFTVLLETSIYSVTWKILLPYCQRSGTVHNSNIFVVCRCVS